MGKTLIGSFNDFGHADQAIKELKTKGLVDSDISAIAKDTERIREFRSLSSGQVADSAATGVAAGAGLGALAGLLVGVGVLTLPGGFLVAGPIAAALGLTGAAATTVSGAVTGAVAGGLVGSLVGLGLPEEEARVLSESVESGNVLLAVNCDTISEETVRDVFSQHMAENVHTVEK